MKYGISIVLRGLWDCVKGIARGSIFGAGAGAGAASRFASQSLR